MKPILYVDDEPAEIFLMQRAFEQAGIEQPLQAVTGGNECVAYLSGQGKYADRARYPLPLLALLDLNMPKTSGFDVLKWIRQTPSLSDLPVLVFSSSSEKTDIQRTTLLGANGYLVKPTNPDWLLDMVKSFKDYWLAPARLTRKITPLGVPTPPQSGGNSSSRSKEPQPGT